MAESVVSLTDEKLFRALANEETVDVSQKLGFTPEEDTETAIQEVEAVANAGRPPSPVSSVNHQSVFKTLEESPPIVEVRSDKTMFDEAVRQKLAGGAPRMAPSMTSVASAPRYGVPSAFNAPPSYYSPPLPHTNSSFHGSGGGGGGGGGIGGGGGTDQMLAKQSALLDLDRLKIRGVSLTREYTLADSLEDMQFELKSHLAHLDEESSVAMMRDFMRVACSGLEMGCSRFGWLELDGWSAEVCDDIRKYDPALSGLYRKYFRRGSSSPETQLLMGLIGSMGLFHVKKKFLRSVGGGATAQSSGRNGMGGGGGLGGMGGGGGLGGLGGIASLLSGMAMPTGPSMDGGPPMGGRVRQRSAYVDSDSEEEAPR